MDYITHHLTRALPLWADRARAKRLFDLGLICLALPLALPIIAVVAALLLSQGGPVLYGQWRVGAGGKPFRMWKFRTMTQSAQTDIAKILLCPHQNAHWQTYAKLRDDPRITPLGRILRRYSLDELPQLWNIARGEMSVVGPRPVPRHELAAHYGPFTATYLSCTPGLTGLWQVSGRNDLDYGARVHLDRDYARTKCLALDIAIILRTVKTVLRGTGC